MRTLRSPLARLALADCDCCRQRCWGRAAIIQEERLTEENQMLVLSRKKDEKIVIGDNITLMVIEIRGDKVRLGIDAPRDVTVHREEIYEAIKREATDVEEQPSAD